MSNAINDPDNYRKMSVPFASTQEAEEAVGKFWEKVFELRKEYKLPDITIVINATAMQEDGSEVALFTHGHIGHTSKAETMLAFALGEETKSRQAEIEALRSGRK